METSKGVLLALFLSHATCSISMVLLNKSLAQGLDYPWTVVFIQNVGTVLLGFVWPLIFGDGRKTAGSHDASVVHVKFLGLKVPKALKNKLWVANQTFWFCLTLFMSLKALRYISVPLYVVARNTVPAVTGVLEYYYSGIALKRLPILGLLLTVVGAVVYTTGDMESASFDAFGCAYAGFLVFIVAACSVVDKTAVRIILDEEKITPVESNQNRVALSMPINVLCIYLFEMYKPNSVYYGGKRRALEESAAGNASSASLASARPFLLQSGGTSTSSSAEALPAASASGVGPILSASDDTSLALRARSSPEKARSWARASSNGTTLAGSAALLLDKRVLLAGATQAAAFVFNGLGNSPMPSDSGLPHAYAASRSSWNAARGISTSTTSTTSGSTTPSADLRVLWSAVNGIDTSMPEMFQGFGTLSTGLLVCLTLSSVFGFGMGTFNFYLQQAVNAATVQVANILYKLATTILSRITHPAPVAGSSWVGFAISLTGIALYTFGNSLQESAVYQKCFGGIHSKRSPSVSAQGRELSAKVGLPSKVCKRGNDVELSELIKSKQDEEEE